MARDFAGILDTEADVNDILVETKLDISQEQFLRMTASRTYVESREDPNPYGGLVGPLTGCPTMSKPEYSNVVYDSPKPYSKRGSMFA